MGEEEPCAPASRSRLVALEATSWDVAVLVGKVVDRRVNGARGTVDAEIRDRPMPREMANILADDANMIELSFGLLKSLAA